MRHPPASTTRTSTCYSFNHYQNHETPPPKAKMSDWIGPNVYRIESFVDKTKHISLSGNETDIHLW